MSKKLTMQVSEAEQVVILGMRETKSLGERRKNYAWNLLHVACKYNEYLYDTGHADAYSTFINNFGYEPGKYESPSAVYKNIEALLVMTQDKAKGAIRDE